MRLLSSIAIDIGKNWVNVSYAAKPYLSAMYCLNTLNDSYGLDSGRSIVNYFLANASQFKGEKANALKLELKTMLKNSV